jgi:putative ABC transport system ATP-binding protein
MIQVENITKIYHGVVPTPALTNISFEIQTGELVAIMGRSGSGKSTLLHLLGLIDAPNDGIIVVDGVEVLKLDDIGKTSFRLKNFGYIFQDYALVAELNALENVYFPAFVLGGNRDAHKKRARSMLEYVGLENRLRHYPHELSGGEQQRVAIARALINEPKILFADEPTANLDSGSTKVVLELFGKLNKELKQTVVMVTHEAEDKKYADRVIWLKDGKIERDERILH